MLLLLKKIKPSAVWNGALICFLVGIANGFFFGLANIPYFAPVITVGIVFIVFLLPRQGFSGQQTLCLIFMAFAYISALSSGTAYGTLFMPEDVFESQKQKMLTLGFFLLLMGVVCGARAYSKIKEVFPQTPPSKNRDL